MIVYRVEAIDATHGPYVAHLRLNIPVSAWQDEPHAEFTGRPTPKQDGIQFELEGYQCGFESMEALQRWFSVSEILRLANLGFVIKTFEVPNSYVYRGFKQLVFKRSYAIELEGVAA